MIPSSRTSCRSIVAAALMFCAASVAQPLSAQSVLLQIRPRIGDTISVRMDQEVEMTGIPLGCAQPRACPDAMRHMTTVMEVFSRAIVKGASSDATMLLAVTDSIRTAVSSTPGKNPVPSRISTPDGEIEFRVAGDGATEIANADASDDLRAIFQQMPAMLSRKPVSVGDTWTREMHIPLAADPGADGRVRASFKFDSLGKNGDIAYISMRGTLSHDRRDGRASELSGSLNGAMQLDRRLAWITETRARIQSRSIVRRDKAPPMTVTTRITQHLKASGSR